MGRGIDLDRPMGGHSWVVYRKVRCRGTYPEDTVVVGKPSKVGHLVVGISLFCRRKSMDLPAPVVQDRRWVCTLLVVVGKKVDRAQGDFRNMDVVPARKEVETGTELADVVQDPVDGKVEMRTAFVWYANQAESNTA